MRILLTGLWLLASLVSLAHAEPRWCSIQPDSGYKIVYPPIARAARVSGIVIARITFVPNGKVLQVEPLSGPVMLREIASRQIEQWQVRTDAPGTDACMGLAIFDFSFEHATPFPEAPPVGILRMSIVTQAPILNTISDPAGRILKKHWWSRK